MNLQTALAICVMLGGCTRASENLAGGTGFAGVAGTLSSGGFSGVAGTSVGGTGAGWGGSGGWAGFFAGGGRPSLAGAGGVGGFATTGGMGGCSGPSGSAAGTSTASRELCDGSKRIRLGFGIKAQGGGFVSPARSMLTDHGHEYFYVDGQCNFWVFDRSTIPHDQYGRELLFWELWPTRTGRLDAVQQELLKRDLLYDRWPQLYGVYGGMPGCVHCPWHTVLDPAGSITCGACTEPCELGQIRHAARAWLSRLGHMGRDSEGGIRVVAYDGLQQVWTGRVLPWNLSFPLAEIVLPDHTDSRGRARLVQGADANMLRAMRQEYLSYLLGVSPKGDGFIPVAEAGGKPWALYMRDALPFENAHGLLSP